MSSSIHTQPDHTQPDHAYIVEIDEITAGIVVREADDARFRFFASSRAFYALDQQCFRTPRAAQRAARALLDSRRAVRHAA